MRGGLRGAARACGVSHAGADARCVSGADAASAGDARGGFLRRVDHGARRAAGGEPAVLGIGAVGVDLPHEGQPGARAGPLGGEPRHHDQDEARIDPGHGPGEGVGDRLVLVREVGEGAVRLDVGDAGARQRGAGLERADLIGDVALDSPRTLLNPVPAEAAQVEEPRMGADGHAAHPRRRRRLDHDVGVTRVEAAGDVGRGDDVEERGIVAEGRDMGTVVFPQATVKVFLTASEAARAERRAAELRAKGVDEATIVAMAADLARRDAADSSRETAPLAQAADAVLVDTSELTLEQVIDRIAALVEERAGLSSV